MRKFIVLGILLLLFLVGCSTKTTDEKVATLVNKYLEAVEINDISSMVKYADDIRFPDKAEQKEQYSTIDFDITDTKKVSETEFEATVELIEEGNLTNFTFPVEKQKTGWKVIVGQDYPLELTQEQKEDYYKQYVSIVEEVNLEYNKDLEISILMSSLIIKNGG